MQLISADRNAGDIEDNKSWDWKGVSETSARLQNSLSSTIPWRQRLISSAGSKRILPCAALVFVFLLGFLACFKTGHMADNQGIRTKSTANIDVTPAHNKTHIKRSKSTATAEKLLAHAGHYSQKALARVTGQRHCRAKPGSLKHAGSKRQTVKVGRHDVNHPMAFPRPDPGQVLLPSGTSGLLTIMTPIWPDNATLALFHNQLRSANMYLNMDSIHEWLLITPSSQIDHVVDFLEDVLELLPCVQPSKIRVVPDEVCAPELSHKVLEDIAARSGSGNLISGWFKQQLIKLACSFTVQTPFYLITDADMFFLRETSALDIMQQAPCTPQSRVCDGTGKIQLQSRVEMLGRNLGGENLRWVQQSGNTLKISPILLDSQNRTMGVTPQTLSTAIVNNLAYYIESKLTGGKSTWRYYLLESTFRSLLSHDVKSGWTEYDLYWEFGVYKELFYKYHVASHLINWEACLWHKDQAPDWRPCQKKDDHGLWALVQSNVRMKASEIWERLAPCMDLSNGQTTRRIYDSEDAANNSTKGA